MLSIFSCVSGPSVCLLEEVSVQVLCPFFNWVVCLPGVESCEFFIYFGDQAAAQFTIAKYWKQPKCPSANEWVPKLWYIDTMEFYAAERKKELIPFATAWMELESVMLSEISQTVRDKYHMISPLTGT